MTVAPHASRRRRIVVTVVVTALLWLMGSFALQEYGVGPALFLFALATIGVIDLYQVVQREKRRRSS